MGDPVIIRLNRRNAWRYGIMLGGATLLLAGAAINEAREDAPMEPGPFLFWVASPFMVLLTLRLFGMARGDAVALRMDRDGVSGFFAGPAKWEDIAKVDVLDHELTMHTYSITSLSRSKTSLGIALRDPMEFRDQQSAWDRLRSWWYGRQTGYHFIISESMTEGMDANALAERAASFRAEKSTPNVQETWSAKLS